jgi:hypothetical protein
VPYDKSVCYASRLSASLSFFLHRFRWPCATASRAYGCDGHRLLAGRGDAVQDSGGAIYMADGSVTFREGSTISGTKAVRRNADPTHARALGQAATLTAVSACVAIEYPTRLARTLLKVV